MAIALNNNIAQAIYAVLKGKSAPEQVLIFPKIVNFLAKKRLLSKTPDILNRLDKIINDDKKKIVAKISSKDELSEPIKKELERLLLERYLAKEVALVSYLDRKLLGGFKIEVNDEVVDLTLKNKLKKLQKHLINI